MRRASRTIALLGLVAASAVLLVAGPARGQDSAQFEVIIVKATNDGNSMDTALNKYAHLLKGKGYTNLSKLGSTAFALAKGAARTVTIVGNLKAEITYKSEINKRVAFKCQITKGGKAQATVNYSVPRGGKTVVVVPMGSVGYMLIIHVR